MHRCVKHSTGEKNILRSARNIINILNGQLGERKGGKATFANIGETGHLGVLVFKLNQRESPKGKRERK